eukprot:TRINITY_DN7466_c0_g1_i1.p1 TRINITY_DN7466_c0_g1~~TRINITY_DN7466_c0_g1_i1.p1  ORF type:complete len:245 (+),score=80.61 TRINITY_DN7466_c0_g1_i1:1053-1787(+)
MSDQEPQAGETVQPQSFDKDPNEDLSASVKTLNRRPPQEEATLGKLLEAIKSNPRYEYAADAFYWRAPIRGALIFGVINLCYFLFTYGEYSPVTMASYTFLASSILCFAFVQVNNFSNKPHPFISRFADSDFGTVEEDIVAGHVRSIIKVAEVSRLLIRDALYWTDPFYSLKFLGLAILKAIAGSYLSIYSLIYFPLVILFIVPRLYQEQQTAIDGVLVKVNTIIQEKGKPVFEKISLLKPKQD